MKYQLHFFVFIKVPSWMPLHKKATVGLVAGIWLLFALNKVISDVGLLCPTSLKCQRTPLLRNLMHQPGIEMIQSFEVPVSLVTTNISTVVYCTGN